MKHPSTAQRLLQKLPRRLATPLYRAANRVPAVRRTIERDYQEMLAEAPAVRPAASRLPPSSR